MRHKFVHEQGRFAAIVAGILERFNVLRLRLVLAPSNELRATGRALIVSLEQLVHTRGTRSEGTAPLLAVLLQAYHNMHLYSIIGGLIALGRS